jgi:hypothetical protein
MAQGNKKTETKYKNYIFVMDHAQIAKLHAEGKKPIYACSLVDFRSHKVNPDRESHELS